MSLSNTFETFRYGTWCSPLSDGGIRSLLECQQAAKNNGITSWGGAAGNSWHSGCIVHKGSAYFVAHTLDGSHDGPASDGYLCHKQILSIPAAPGTPCKEIDADTIWDIQVCSRAAQEMGINYASTAGPEWTGGCIVNGGNAYFSDPEVRGSRDHIPDQGSICLQRQQILVTTLDEKEGLRDEQLVVDEQEKERLMLEEEKEQDNILLGEQEKVVTEETTTFQEAPRLKTEEELVETRLDESSYAAIDDGSSVLTKEDFAKMEQENLNLVKEIQPHLAWGGLCDVNECAEWKCPTWCFCFQAFPFFETAWDFLPNQCPSDGEECDCTPGIEAEIDGFQPVFAEKGLIKELIQNPMGPFEWADPLWQPIPMVKWMIPSIEDGDWFPSETEMHQLKVLFGITTSTLIHSNPQAYEEARKAMIIFHDAVQLASREELIKVIEEPIKEPIEASKIEEKVIETESLEEKVIETESLDKTAFDSTESLEEKVIEEPIKELTAFNIEAKIEETKVETVIDNGDDSFDSYYF